PSLVVGSSVSTTFRYYHQYHFSLTYSVLGGGKGFSVPAFGYVSLGSSFSVSLSSGGFNDWLDAGTNWSIQSFLTGSTTTERWQMNQPMSGVSNTFANLALAY